MNKSLRIFIPVMMVLFVYNSCKKEQPISVIPAIKFVSMAPNPAKKYQDTVTIVISYVDGDGDLGIDSPDAKNLYVTDSRNNVVSQFRIHQLAPTGSNIAIEGNLDVVLPPQGFVNDSNTTETATFSIYVVDRAGHQSNTVQTTPLVINQ
jgi:hypothetical protein